MVTQRENAMLAAKQRALSLALSLLNTPRYNSDPELRAVVDEVLELVDAKELVKAAVATLRNPASLHFTGGVDSGLYPRFGTLRFLSKTYVREFETDTGRPLRVTFSPDRLVKFSRDGKEIFVHVDVLGEVVRFVNCPMAPPDAVLPPYNEADVTVTGRYPDNQTFLCQQCHRKYAFGPTRCKMKHGEPRNPYQHAYHPEVFCSIACEDAYLTTHGGYPPFGAEIPASDQRETSGIVERPGWLLVTLDTDRKLTLTHAGALAALAADYKHAGQTKTRDELVAELKKAYETQTSITVSGRTATASEKLIVPPNKHEPFEQLTAVDDLAKFFGLEPLEDANSVDRRDLRKSLRAGAYEMSEEEREAQRVSFVYGNLNLDGVEVTKKEIAEAADRLRAEAESSDGKK